MGSQGDGPIGPPGGVQVDRKWDPRMGAMGQGVPGEAPEDPGGHGAEEPRGALGDLQGPRF